MSTPSTPQATAASATVTYDGGSVTLPVVEGSEGETAIVIETLRAKTGLITLDPGYGNTGSCRSAVTFIDGEKGILRYRGYAIDELAAKSTFLEVAWLLIHGELPTGRSSTSFTRGDHAPHAAARELPPLLRRAARRTPTRCRCARRRSRRSPPSTRTPETDKTVHETVVRLIAKMPTIAAYSYKHSIGQPFIYPQNRLDYSSNFLHMMFATPVRGLRGGPGAREGRSTCCSSCTPTTSRTARPARCAWWAASRANLYASISAGISALWGPLHGGANQQVIEMLEHIQAEGGDVQKFVDKAKDKKDNSRLMGFGHRVYKNYDPRAAILKKSCTQVLEKLGVRSSLLEIAMKLEEIALKDDYFVSHKLYPNVDFYSGIIYQALGIPVNMFTVMFTMGRMPGWIAQWLEMRRDPETRIGRPRQVYTGATLRAYQPIDARR